MSWTRGKIIGRGSSATVYAATCHKSGETIAVKSAEFHSSEFLTREAKILSSLNSSPYVIGYRGYEITKTPSATTRNLLMEYAPYGTLTDVTAKNGGFLEEARVVCYTRQILLGLEYIHSSGIAHCDVKGSNVLVGKNGEAKIADFGCAKFVEPEVITEPVKGTPAFMAPEVARGEEQGKESDIWAVGCTVIEMLTGLTPWIGGGDPVSVLYRVGYLGESPELPSTLTEQAKDFLGKCFEKKAKERWTASQLLNHPFLMVTKPELVETNGLVTTSSPTSVTDQMFWRSVEEEEGDDLDRRSWWECHEDERIRVLSSWMGPTWDMDGGDWITVRRTE